LGKRYWNLKMGEKKITIVLRGHFSLIPINCACYNISWKCKSDQRIHGKLKGIKRAKDNKGVLTLEFVSSNFLAFSSRTKLYRKE